VLIFAGLIAAYFALTVKFAVGDPALAARRPLLGWLVVANDSAQRLVSRPYQEVIARGAGATLRSLG